MDIKTSSPASTSTPQKPSLGFLPQPDTVEPNFPCHSSGGACMLPSDYHTTRRKSHTADGGAHYEGSPSTAAKSTATPNRVSHESSLNLDHIISRILQFNSNGGRIEGGRPLISQFEVASICDLASKVFLLQPSLLELTPADTGLTVVGDLHGHLTDVAAIFAKEGSPDVHNYIFLGNYVDKGRHQVELLCLLLCYKLKYPENVFLLRGAHETRETNRNNGFWQKCRNVYPEEIWQAFNGCFDAMPLAAVLGDRIFCVHSGISPELQSLGQLRNVRRPTGIPNKGLLFDLLWATPTTTTPGWDVSQQGTAMVFGKGVSRKFAQANELEFMIRGHTTSGKGYRLSPDKKILSLFSAANYDGRVNDAAFAHIGVNLTIQVYSFDTNGVCQEQKLDSPVRS